MKTKLKFKLKDPALDIKPNQPEAVTAPPALAEKQPLPQTSSVHLNEEQAAAKDCIMQFATSTESERFMMMSGYAGTGKTTAACEIVRELLQLKKSVMICAPTNKAVQVLKSKICEALSSMEDDDHHNWDRKTNPFKQARLNRKDREIVIDPGTWAYGSLHSALGLSIEKSDSGNQSCVRDRDPTLHMFDVVIVDECLMISKDLYAHIMGCFTNRAGNNTKIIFIGDPAQLPPVGDGKISITFTIDNAVTLRNVVRQAQDNPIIKLSMTARQFIDEQQRLTIEDIANNVPQTEGAEVDIDHGGVSMALGIALHELEYDRTVRILAYTNARVRAYNKLVHEELYGPDSHRFVVGEPVIFYAPYEFAYNENSVPCRVINSQEGVIRGIDTIDVYEPNTLVKVECYRLKLEMDTGTILYCNIPVDEAEHQYMVQAKFDESKQQRVDMEIARKEKRNTDAENHKRMIKKCAFEGWRLIEYFARLQHGYAITTHKSQGSTFHTVVVDYADLSKMRDTFEFNRALYVACTRSSKYLAIVT